MIIKRKLYSVMDEEGNLGYYLYDEATGEEKLFTKRDLIDEDFLEEQEELKKNDRRTAKILIPVTGGMLGAGLGVAGGGKGALIGTAVGTGLGYLGGKKLAKASDKKYDKLINRYKSAKTKEEKAYLRHKMEKEMDRRNIASSAAMAGAWAGRSR